MKKIFFITLIEIFLIFLVFVSADAQQLVISYVIKIDDNLLYFDRGANANIRIGDEFRLLRDMPDNRDDKKIGVVRITQVFPEVSIGKIIEITADEKLSVLDKIEISPVVEIPELLKNISENDDFLAPVIHHNRVQIAEKGKDIDLIVRANALEGLNNLYTKYISDGLVEWERVDFLSYESDIYFCRIPSENILGDSLRYFIIAEDIDGRTASVGIESDPVKVNLVSSLFGETKKTVPYAASGSYWKINKRIFIPGYMQLKRKELGKGYMIITLEAASLIGGIVADKNNGIYLGTAAAVYLYNIFDGIIGSK